MFGIETDYLYINSVYTILRRSSQIAYADQHTGDELIACSSLEVALKVARHTVNKHPDEYPYGIKVSEDATDNAEWENYITKDSSEAGSDFDWDEIGHGVF